MSAPAPHTLSAPEPAAPPLTCRLCGQEHRHAPLRRGQRALCVRCGTLLARRGWLGRDAARAFAWTGAALALPAAMLPFIQVAKLGRVHTGHLLTGATALWEDGMPLLAVWVALCGAIAPVLLLVTLAGGPAGPRRWAALRRPRVWTALAHALEHWAMPEVHVLAILVALIKLGALVDVQIGAGFWCYSAMSIALLIAWRAYDAEAAR